MVRPFSSQGDNVIGILNELIIVCTFISVYVMNKCSFSELTMKVWGWVLIIPIIISLLLTWVISLPDAIKEFKESLIGLCKKEKKRVESKSSDPKAAVTCGDSKEKSKKKAELEIVRSNTVRH